MVRPKNGRPIWREGGQHADHDLAQIVDEVATTLEKIESRAKPTTSTATVVSPEPADQEQSLYIHTFGTPPTGMPDKALQLDWQAHFQFKPRQVPNETLWQKTLLPQLQALTQEIEPGQTIRLRGSPTLTVSFAVGNLFPEVGRYGLLVDQFYSGQTHLWSAHAEPPPTATRPQFITHPLPGDAAATEGIVIVLANPRQLLDQVVADVGRYFGQAQAFEQSLAGTETIQGYRGALVLAAEATTTHKRGLTNWEAVALAQHASDPVRPFITGLTKLHIFMAVPMALAAFTGHYWNALGLPAQFYEWVGGPTAYAPGWTIDL